MRFKGYTDKTALTVAGEVCLRRGHYRCAGCGQASRPFDDWAGLGRGMLTVRSQRLVSLAGSSWSFDTASDRLHEMCGLRVSDQTIRRACDASGQEAQGWLDHCDQATQGYRAAQGQGEFYTDGTSVNTTEGWREIRMNVFAKREAGQPVEADRWSDRSLPSATARVAFAAILDSESLGDKWSRWAERLGVGQGRNLSVLGDGAKWIWNQANKHLPHAEQTVDVYHVSEHLHDCGKVLHGEGDPSRQWADDQLLSLMRQPPLRYLQDLDALRRPVADSGPSAALDAVYQYLSDNWERLDYRQRLAAGRTIGSGMVEGACKTVVGRRLKALSARWRPERAEHMAALCCLHYSNLWPTFWHPAATRAAA